MPRAGVRGQAAGDRDWRRTGQPDSTGTTSTAHPAVDGWTDDTAHQRQARTARVRGGGQPRRTARSRCPRRTATTESTATPDTPPATRAPRGIQRTPATTATLTNTSHSDGHTRGGTSDAAQAAGRAIDRRIRSQAPGRLVPVHGPQAPRPRPGACPPRAAGPGSAGLAASGSRPDPSGCGAPSVSSRSSSRSSPPGWSSCRASTRTTTPRSPPPRAPRRSPSRRRARRSTTATAIALAQTVDASKIVADPTDAHQDATKIAVILHNRLGVDYIDAVAKLRKTSTRYVELARHVKPELAAAVVRRDPEARLSRACTPPRTPCGSTRTASVAANLVGFVNDEGHGGPGFESALDTHALRRQRLGDLRGGGRTAAPAGRQHDRRARRRGPASG